MSQGVFWRTKGGFGTLKDTESAFLKLETFRGDTAVAISTQAHFCTVHERMIRSSSKLFAVVVEEGGICSRQLHGITLRADDE